MLKDNRMRVIADLVRKGGTVCDVGTDHAFIPVELILSGKCKGAVITDISAPSLEKGITNVKKSGIRDKVKSFCANGTLGAELDGVTDVIIAGMGGELISSIIGQDPRLKNEALRFILQPMSRAEELRIFLAENGFETEKEIKVESEGRFYAILQVRYTGKSFSPDTRHILLGVTPNAENEADIRYAEKILHVLETKLSGIKMSAQTDTDTSDIDEKIKCINNFLGK